MPGGGAGDGAEGVVSSRRTYEWRVARHVSQDIGMPRPARSGGVEGAPCHHRCCRGGPEPGGGGPGLRGVPGVGVAAGGPVPGRGRGGVRAPLPAAEDLPRAVPESTAELIIRLRKELADRAWLPCQRGLLLGRFLL